MLIAVNVPNAAPLPQSSWLPPSTLAYFRPPPPLANMRVHQMASQGFERIDGPADQDLLLVAPDHILDGKYRLWVEGFRGIYLIGGSFEPRPHGTLVTPKGQTVEGIGALIKLRTHEQADRPFIYLSRLDFRASDIRFGDWLQVGGSSDPNSPQAWPDIVRFMIKAEALAGWRGYFGGSLSQHVSHSDFFKMEMGGVRHSFAAHIHSQFGYQSDYIAPSWRAGFQPYRGPDGVSQFHFFNYWAEPVHFAGIGGDPNPIAFFLARNAEEVARGQANRFFFHNNAGAGVGISPVRDEHTTAAMKASFEQGGYQPIHPKRGRYGPVQRGQNLTWDQTNSLAQGQVRLLAPGETLAVVSACDVGHQHRITSRDALLALIEDWNAQQVYAEACAR